MLRTCGGIYIARGNALHANVCIHMHTKLQKRVCCNHGELVIQGQHELNAQPSRDQDSWNSLIKSCSKRGDYRRSLSLYEKMQRNDFLQPSIHTFVALLKACAKLKDVERGSKIHADISKQGLEAKDAFVGSALIDMYAKCGSFSKAHDVFDKLSVRNTVSWTALITGYADNHLGTEALICFEQMRDTGIHLDAITYVCALKACCLIQARGKGQEIHLELTSKGLERDLVLGSTLIALYAKCGLLAEGRKVFETLSPHDAVSWTTLIAGYAESGRGEDALRLFEQMQHDGFAPDAATFVCSLKACGSIGAAEKGLKIHAEIVRKELGGNSLVGNTLVDMYVKCGLLATAQETFDGLSTKDIILWTTLLTGYTQVGNSQNVFSTFHRMIQGGIRPNLATFIGVLNACSHAGLMPCHPVLPTWHAVLAACQKSSNVELGQLAFDSAMQVDGHDVSSYVCMYNIYADQRQCR